MRTNIYISVSELEQLSKNYNDDFSLTIDRDDYIPLMKANGKRWREIVKGCNNWNIRAKFFREMTMTATWLQRKEYGYARMNIKSMRSYRRLYEMDKLPK